MQATSNAVSQENSHLALSLSSNTIKFYPAVTGQYVGECRGHNGTIHEISFSVPSSPQTICSCSSDGTVRAWDAKTFKQVSLRTTSSKELYSFSFGGSSGNLLAGGCNAQDNRYKVHAIQDILMCLGRASNGMADQWWINHCT